MLEIDPQTRAKIVQLRKEKTTIVSISESTGINPPCVANVLKEELEEKYDSYSLKSTKKVFSKQQKREVVTLRKNCISLDGIKDITGILVHNIQAILE